MNGLPKLATAAVLLFTPPLAQSPKKMEKLEKKVQELERNFEKQKDPIHQAKALAKLLPKEIVEATWEIQQGGVSQGIARLERYRDAARRVHRALVGTGRNPVKKPAGFVQLQIALRESVRDLGDALFVVPFERRQPVEEVRADLDQMNNELLQQLFPPPPPPKPKKKKRKARGGKS